LVRHVTACNVTRVNSTTRQMRHVTRTATVRAAHGHNAAAAPVTRPFNVTGRNL